MLTQNRVPALNNKWINHVQKPKKEMEIMKFNWVALINRYIKFITRIAAAVKMSILSILFYAFIAI